MDGVPAEQLVHQLSWRQC